MVDIATSQTIVELAPLIPISSQPPINNRKNFIRLADGPMISPIPSPAQPHKKHTYAKTPDPGVSLKIVACIVTWYAFSSLGNNVSKTILKELPLSMTLSIFQLGFLALFTLMQMRVFKTHTYVPFSSTELLTKISPLSIGSIFGTTLSYISLEHVPVSYTHIIKSTSPISSFILSKIMLNKTFTIQQTLSLIPIIVGVCMCSLTEINFNLIGFLSAFIATLIFSFRNIYVKKLFYSNKIPELPTQFENKLSDSQKYNHVNILFHTSSLAFMLLLPFWFFADGIHILFNYFEDPVINHRILSLYFLDGICNFGQSITAYWILTQISALSYSIANTFKRVFVIISSVLWFRNPVGPLNMFGIFLAVLGVFLYNRASVAKKRKIVLKHST